MVLTVMDKGPTLRCAVFGSSCAGGARALRSGCHRLPVVRVPQRRRRCLLETYGVLRRGAPLHARVCLLHAVQPPREIEIRHSACGAVHGAMHRVLAQAVKAAQPRLLGDVLLRRGKGGGVGARARGGSTLSSAPTQDHYRAHNPLLRALSDALASRACALALSCACAPSHYAQPGAIERAQEADRLRSMRLAQRRLFSLEDALPSIAVETSFMRRRSRWLDELEGAFEDFESLRALAQELAHAVRPDGLTQLEESARVTFTEGLVQAVDGSTDPSALEGALASAYQHVDPASPQECAAVAIQNPLTLSPAHHGAPVDLPSWHGYGLSRR